MTLNKRDFIIQFHTKTIKVRKTTQPFNGKQLQMIYRQQMMLSL